MAIKLTDGEISIGAFMFPDRKKPCLCIEEGNQGVVYGHFNSKESAVEFMNRLGNMVNAVFVDGAEDGR